MVNSVFVMDAARLADALESRARLQRVTERDVVAFSADAHDHHVRAVFRCSERLTGQAAAMYTYGLLIDVDRAPAFYLIGPGESLAEVIWFGEIEVPQATSAPQGESIDSDYWVRDGVLWRAIPPRAQRDQRSWHEA